MRALLPPVLLALLLTGCGSGSDNATSSTSAPPTTVAVDQAKVKEAVVRAADLPGVWFENTSVSTNTAVQSANNSLSSCLGLSNTPTVAQTRFEKDGQAITSNARIYASTEVARADLAALRSPQASSCAAPQVNILVKNSVESVNANPKTRVSAIPERTFRDDEFGLRATSTVGMMSGPVEITTDFLGVTVGQAQATFTMTYIASAPPRDLEDRLFAELRKRLS